MQSTENNSQVSNILIMGALMDKSSETQGVLKSEEDQTRTWFSRHGFSMLISVSILIYFLLISVIITILASVNMEYRIVGLLIIGASLLWIVLMTAFRQFYKRNEASEEGWSSQHSNMEKRPECYLNIDNQSHFIKQGSVNYWEISQTKLKDISLTFYSRNK